VFSPKPSSARPGHLFERFPLALKTPIVCALFPGQVFHLSSEAARTSADRDVSGPPPHLRKRNRLSTPTIRLCYSLQSPRLCFSKTFGFVLIPRPTAVIRSFSSTPYLILHNELLFLSLARFLFPHPSRERLYPAGIGMHISPHFLFLRIDY